MGQISLQGAIVAGPVTASETFPASTLNVPLATIFSPKPSAVSTGVLTRNVNVAVPAFGALQGVGPTDTVTQGDFLYFKSNGPVILRVTTDDGLGGQAQALVPVHGIAMLEFQATRPLELLEIQGNARVEYLVSGPS